MKKFILCFAIVFSAMFITTAFAVEPKPVYDEPNYEDLPYGMTYLGPGDERYPNSGIIQVEQEDGESAFFVYGEGPMRFFEEGEDFSTFDILSAMLDTGCLNDTYYTNSQYYENHLEFLFWKYPEFKEVFFDSDFTAELLQTYRVYTIEAIDLESAFPGSGVSKLGILLPVIAKNFTLGNLEYLMVCDQLMNGEYSILEKQAMVDAFEDAAGLTAPLKAFFSSTTLRTPYSTYSQYVKETGRFSCSFLLDSIEIGESPLFAVDTGTPLYDYEEIRLTLPNGKIVIAMTGIPEMTEFEKFTANETDSLLHPLANRVGPPTRNYNCHSYAWWAQTTSNKYWINNPEPFKTSGSGYTKITSIPRSGDIIWWGNDDHSGVYRYTDPDGMPYVTSKWEEHGLYEHRANGCPYKWGSYTIYRKQ